MKKTSLVAAGILALGCLSAADNAGDWQQNLGLKASMGFESEHVVRGRKEISRALTGDIRLSYKAMDELSVYGGVEYAIAMRGSSKTFIPEQEEQEDRPGREAYNMWYNNSIVKPYIGVSYEVYEGIALDLGYIHNIYLRHANESLANNHDLYIARTDKRNSSEIYAGVVADCIANPSLYLNYNFDAEELNIEGAVKHCFDLGEYSINGLAVEVGANIGFNNCRKLLWKDQNGIKENYFYYGLNADLVYNFNENASAKVGCYFAGNTGKINNANMFQAPGEKFATAAYDAKGTRNMIWWTAGVDCQF